MYIYSIKATSHRVVYFFLYLSLTSFDSMCAADSYSKCDNGSIASINSSDTSYAAFIFWNSNVALRNCRQRSSY